MKASATHDQCGCTAPRARGCPNPALRRARAEVQQALLGQLAVLTAATRSAGCTATTPASPARDEIARVSPNVTRLFDGLVHGVRSDWRAGLRPPQHRPAAPDQAPGQLSAAVPGRILSGVFRAASGIPITRQGEHDQLAPGFLPRTASGDRPQLRGCQRVRPERPAGHPARRPSPSAK